MRHRGLPSSPLLLVKGGGDHRLHLGQVSHQTIQNPSLHNAHGTWKPLDYSTRYYTYWIDKSPDQCSNLKLEQVRHQTIVLGPKSHLEQARHWTSTRAYIWNRSVIGLELRPKSSLGQSLGQYFGLVSPNPKICNTNSLMLFNLQTCDGEGEGGQCWLMAY